MTEMNEGTEQAFERAHLGATCVSYILANDLDMLTLLREAHGDEAILQALIGQIKVLGHTVAKSQGTAPSAVGDRLVAAVDLARAWDLPSVLGEGR